MSVTLRSSWLAVSIATIAVVSAGASILQGVSARVNVPCRGRLEVVSPTPPIEPTHPVSLETSDLQPRWEATRTGATARVRSMRIVWAREGGPMACSDVAVPWSPVVSPDRLTLGYDAPRNLFIVGGGTEDVVFRRVDGPGTRAVPAELVGPHTVPLFVFLIALGALAIAAGRVVRATPYARTVVRWKGGTLRPDGLVEGEDGATLGRIDERAGIAPGDVLVDPAAVADRGVYRELPLLGRTTIAAGSHARWQAGTARRLRDARILAIVSLTTTVLAMAAHLVAG